MPRIIPPDGDLPCDLLLVGERPGSEEYETGMNFVGPAGEELWSRLWRVCKLERHHFRVINLVPVFSIQPPTPAEVAKYWYLVKWELSHTRPRFILTIGYHAARALLPQFKDIRGDYFHGLPFAHSSGATVLPSVHSSAALREPGRYQDQLSEDLLAFRRLIDGRLHPRALRSVPVKRVTRAHLGGSDQLWGLDSEGPTVRQVECVTIGTAAGAYIEETPSNTLSPFTAAALANNHLIIHNAKRDWQSLLALGVTPRHTPHCTMIQAYLLGRPQSLKLLGFRHFGYQMEEYDDLVQPLDDILVRSTLKEKSDVQRQANEEAKLAEKAARQAARAVHAHDRQRRGRAAQRRNRDDPKLRARGSPLQSGGEISNRALSSIKRILDTDAEKTPRQRWKGSAFYALVPLPPPPTWKDVPSPRRETYALADSVVHRDLHHEQMPLITRKGLTQVYAIDRGVLPWLVRNEQMGMACDPDRLRELSAEFAADFTRLGKRIDALAGYHVNPLSGEQVSDCLFLDRRKARVTRRTKSGSHFTTADKYLKARRNEDRLIPMVLESRQLNKYISTYLEKLPAMLLQDDDGTWRYHSDWRNTTTATGRLAEQIITLIPKHDPLAKDEGRMNRATAIRDCFYALPGHRLVSVDLSQIELRVAADVSGDEELTKAFRSGVDLHSKVAHELLGAPKRKEDQDESRHRLPIKTFHFSICNGTTEFGILDQLHEQGQLHWKIDEVQKLLQEWFVLHKGMARYWDHQKAFARQHGYIVTKFGRIRRLTAIWSTAEHIVREAERQCLCGIQSAADDISKIWNKKMWHKVIVPRHGAGNYCEPWVRIHDDTTLEVDKHQSKAVATEMLALVPQLLHVPTTAEAKFGRRWGSLEKVH